MWRLTWCKVINHRAYISPVINYYDDLELEIKICYEPGCSTTMMLSLRQHFVRSIILLSIFCFTARPDGDGNRPGSCFRRYFIV